MSPKIRVSICEDDPECRDFLYNLFTYQSEKADLDLHIEVCPSDKIFEPDPYHWVLRDFGKKSH